MSSRPIESSAGFDYSLIRHNRDAAELLCTDKELQAFCSTFKQTVDSRRTDDILPCPTYLVDVSKGSPCRAVTRSCMLMCITQVQMWTLPSDIIKHNWRESSHLSQRRVLVYDLQPLRPWYLVTKYKDITYCNTHNLGQILREFGLFGWNRKVHCCSSVSSLPACLEGLTVGRITLCRRQHRGI